MSALWTITFVYLWAFAADALWIQPARRLAAVRARIPYSRGAWSVALLVGLPAMVVVLLVRTFVADVYHVPTPSMQPRLQVDQLILVNRLAYGLRLPLTGDTLLGRARPRPGEIIAFHYPREPATVYVKRVLAVGGDRVRVVGRELEVNGRRISREWVGEGSATQQTVSIGETSVVLQADLAKPLVLPPVDRIVPDGHYFVIGDSLDHSRDSREWGFVADRHLIGRVVD